MEIKGQDPLLLVSVYMPCKDLQDSTENYENCLAELSESVAKFSSSHRIVIGGDFNEDIMVEERRRRQSDSGFCQSSLVKTSCILVLLVKPTLTQMGLKPVQSIIFL